MLTKPLPDRHRKSVLVIDDEDENFFTLAEVLKRRGYHCLSATGMNEALAVLENNPGISAVLMDVMLPGINGYEATKSLKSDERFAHLPVIVLTGLSGEAEKQKALAAGAAAFFTKPVKLAELLALLKPHANEV